MRPWTIMYSHPQKIQLQSIEKQGPFDGKAALIYFQQHLTTGSVLVAILPGCHSSQVIVPQYYRNEATIGD